MADTPQRDALSILPILISPPMPISLDRGADGDYDITIPANTPAGLYSIRVGLAVDEWIYDCSDTFEIIAEDDNNDDLFGL